MMKILMGILLVLGAQWQLGAQTAQEIIAEHIARSGGEKAWKQLHSIVIEGYVTVGVSEPIHLKVEHRRPYFKRVSFVVAGKEQLSEGYDGKQAFTYNELNGKYKKLSEYTPDAFETDILDYQDKGFKARFLNKEKVNGVDCFKVELIKNTVHDFYWFSTQNYELLKEENANETVYYSDFKKVEGLTFAHTVTSEPKGGSEYVIHFDTIKPNAAIADKRFVFE